MPKHPGGRPKIDLDWDIIKNLCGIQCLQEEIAQVMGCSLDTVERACRRTHGVSFAEFYRQKKGVGRVSLRRKQWEIAMRGDKTMLIWLGKQALGQADKLENTHIVEDRPLAELSDGELEKVLFGE